MASSIARRASGAGMNTEQRLIERYFSALGARRTDVLLGPGDDAALLAPPAGASLALTTDTLVLDTHFGRQSDPHSIGHRALAVNLSDLAAMGAQPTWALLSLNLPAVDEAWLAAFADGFGALAVRHSLALVGGNISRGPLAITVQAAGIVPAGDALMRRGAQAGDLVMVSGCLGDAAALLAVRAGRLPADEQSRAALARRADFPEPRVALGLALRGLASACLDVSDGLATDLPRLLAASDCGAALQLEALPVSPALRATAGELAWQHAWLGGEDYELCFTLPPERLPLLRQRLAGGELQCRSIGQCLSSRELALTLDGKVTQVSTKPFAHFD